MENDAIEEAIYSQWGNSCDIQDTACEDRIYDPLYKELALVLQGAYDQASSGKGRERHSSGEAFENQQICEIARRLKEGGVMTGPLYQAVKKCYESCRLINTKGKEATIRELYGAIVYISGAIKLVKELNLEA